MVKFSEEWFRENYPSMPLDDLNKIWKCVLCDWQIELPVPMIIGMVCCGNCGQSTLRPIHDFPEFKKEQNG